MDAVKIIAKIASLIKEIYRIVQEVKAQKHQSKRLYDRIVALKPIVEKTRKLTEHDDKVYQEALRQLVECLERVKEFIATFKEWNLFGRFLHRGDIKQDFNDFNGLLDKLVPQLSLGVEVEMQATLNIIQDQQKKILENNEDEERDRKECKSDMEDLQKGQQVLGDQMDSGFESLTDQFAGLHDAFAGLTCVEFKPKESVVAQPADDLERMQIKLDDLESKKWELIGEGWYGEVYKARHRGDEVAIKSFKAKGGCTQIICRDFRREAENMRKLNSMSIVRLLGICTEGDNNLIIMEFMENKSLRYVLDNPDKFELDWKTRKRMARDGACGIMYIHKARPPMLHGYITSDKFLVSECMRVKLSVSGSSAAEDKSSGRKSNVKYRAPENLDNINPCTKRSEVYAYGIVMWEIATSLKPFDGWSDVEIRKLVVEQGGCQDIPKDLECPSDFEKIINGCRLFDPHLRLPIEQIVDDLQYH